MKENEYKQKEFTTKEIKKGLEAKGLSDWAIRNAHKDLVKLWAFNIVGFKGKHLLDENKVWFLKD